MKRILSYLSLRVPMMHVYMLQQVEYNASKFIRWAGMFPDLSDVKKRGELKSTSRAQLMLGVAYGGWMIPIISAPMVSVATKQYLFLPFIVWAPATSLLAIYFTTSLLQDFVVTPKQKTEINAAKKKLDKLPATRIAVIGSYGKTSMKEMLQTVLSEGMRTTATPGNKNILISHARWVNKLAGDEEVLIFEYGESAPGDILKLASLSEPHKVVITGLAPAHLDYYPSLEAIADDFASIQEVVTSSDDRYVHADSDITKQKITGQFYDVNGVSGWKVSNVSVGFEGTKFTLKKGKRKLQLHTQLIGEHHVGPLSAVVAIAADLGMTDVQIVEGVAATKPFEHRMQARPLHGAWIIDDTYNGNIEGMRAGLKLLNVLPAKQRIYVTPGLVDQGVENESVHQELGRLIGHAHPNKVVLMQNSNTTYIQQGLEEVGYDGELVVEDQPLEFYTQLEHYLVAGDVVMMQNDLPDSYC